MFLMLAYTLAGGCSRQNTLLTMFIIGCTLYALTMAIIGIESIYITILFGMDMIFVLYKIPCDRYRNENIYPEKKLYIVEDNSLEKQEMYQLKQQLNTN